MFASANQKRITKDNELKDSVFEMQQLKNEKMYITAEQVFHELYLLQMLE